MSYIKQLRNFGLFTGGAVFHHYVSKALDYSEANEAEKVATLNSSKLDQITNVEYIKTMMDRKDIDNKIISGLNKLDDKLDKLDGVSKVSDVKDIIKDVKNTTDELVKLLENSGSSKKNFINFNEFFESLDNLTLFQESSLLHFIMFLIILLSVVNIVFILFGNEIIVNFNLENRFPKLANFLKLRNKLSKYSLY